MARRYRYAIIKKKEAAKGKLSVGLAIASLLLFGGAVGIAYVLEGSYGFIVGGICLFAALLSVYGFLMGISSFTKDLIESADMSGDDEVRIFGEEFLMKVSPFIKQAEEWSNAAKIMDPNSLNIHIKDYTHFIEL